MSSSSPYWKDSDYPEIDFKALDYEPVVPASSQKGLTIAAAKAGLAIGLNVPESAIEIIVRA